MNMVIFGQKRKESVNLDARKTKPSLKTNAKTYVKKDFFTLLETAIPSAKKEKNMLTELASLFVEKTKSGMTANATLSAL